MIICNVKTSTGFAVSSMDRNGGKTLSLRTGVTRIFRFRAPAPNSSFSRHRHRFDARREELKLLLPPDHAKPRGEYQVVPLQTRRRVADIAVGERELPAQPILQLRRQGGIELETILAGVREVREDREPFAKGAALRKLRVKLLANQRLGTVLVYRCYPDDRGRRGGVHDRVRAKFVAVIIEAAEHIEDVTVRFDDVIAHATAVNLPQVQVLELVGLETGNRKDE